MSAKVVSRTSLVCDTCGLEHLALVADATMARVAAAADGWKYIKYDRIARTSPSKGGRGSPRSWDACPSCEIPSTPEAALGARNKPKASPKPRPVIVPPVSDPETSDLIPWFPDAARLLGGISRTTTYKMIKSGQLRSVTIGRRRLIERTEIDAYIARHRQGGPTP